VCVRTTTAALVAANPGLGKLLFALLFPVGLTMNTLHGTGACVHVRGQLLSVAAAPASLQAHACTVGV
jgi:hypothetical protein